ncbi:hypothetical protein V1502_14575 [Bacillus sp. SCS-153A]|uniref:hypothetical protein n=1 Tax=Rossellomorea sedimentorum TaxID=3115294 RepID=UPI00390652BE
MKTNLSHAQTYNSPVSRFHYEIFAWSRENNRIESKQLSNFSNWKDFNYVVKEETFTEGSILSFSVENKMRVHRRLKIFFLLDWRTDGKERISIISPDNHPVYHYSSTKHSLVDYQVNNGSGLIRRSVYPLSDKGIFHWKETLRTGSIPYQPLLKGAALTVVCFDLLFTPLQKIQGHVLGVEAETKEDLRNLHKHLKNRLAFHRKK